MIADSQVSVRMQPACQSSNSTQASSILREFNSSSEHVKLKDLADICLRPMDAGVPKGKKGTQKIAGTCLVMTRIRYPLLADDLIIHSLTSSSIHTSCLLRQFEWKGVQTTSRPIRQAPILWSIHDSVGSREDER